MVKKFLSIILFIILMIPFIWIGVTKYQSNFSSEKWIENPSKRVQIVDDMLGEYNLTGMNKNEVIELLGDPTKDAYFKEKTNIVYYLGDERGFISIDSEWLILDLDNHGKVIKYEILTD